MPANFQRSTLWHKLASFAPGRLMVLVGVIALLFVWRRWRMPWWLWSGGALLWVVAVAMKAGIALIANAPVNQALHAGLPKNLADLFFWLYVGLLTGVFECGIFLAVAPLFRRKAWSWREAVSLGVGFGAIEAVALGAGTIFAASKTGIWAPAATDVGSLSAAFERVLALIVHVTAAVMVIRSLTTRRWGWFVASFWYKTSVDAVAAWLLFSNSSLRSHPWLMEFSCFGPFALLGLFVLWRLKEEFHEA